MRPDPRGSSRATGRPYDRPVATAVTLFGVDSGTETAIDEACYDLSLGGVVSSSSDFKRRGLYLEKHRLGGVLLGYGNGFPLDSQATP